MASSNDRLRVAIAGCHRMVTSTRQGHNWAAAFAAVPETELVAVFDYGAATRAAAAACWGVPAYDDYDQLLAEVRPHVVGIATRQTLHVEQVERAVAAGVRGILLDKPLATSLAEADRLLAMCRNRVALAFGLDRRWSVRYRALARVVAEGVIGPVEEIAGYGMPNLINHGCHWYDTLLMLLGDPEPAWVAGLVDEVGGEPPDSRHHLDPPGRGQIGMVGGVVASVSPVGGPRPSFLILGRHGRLVIADDAQAAWLWRAAEGAGNQPVQPEAVTLPTPDADWPEGPAAVRDLVQAVRSGTTTACDIEHARRATEIGFALHRSHAANGARLALPVAERDQRIASLPWGNEPPPRA